MPVEINDVDSPESLTPAWHVARNIGAPLNEVIKSLKRRGVPVVLDDDCKAAFRKADLYALIVGE